MADDLEAFLRQAAQRRAGRKKTAPAQPQPQPAKRPQPPRRQPAMEAEVVEAVVVPDPHNRLEMNVDTSDFERRAEHLGEEVGLADENLEARLHEKFDHKLGTLGEDGIDSPTDVASDSAERFLAISEITELLADPNSLRNAIVISEIFAPPHHRW